MSKSPALPLTLIGPFCAWAETLPLTSWRPMGPLLARATKVPLTPSSPIGPFDVRTLTSAPGGVSTMSCTFQLRPLGAPLTRTRFPSIARRTLSAACCASAWVSAPTATQAVIEYAPPVPLWNRTPPFISGSTSRRPADMGTTPCCTARATS